MYDLMFLFIMYLFTYCSVIFLLKGVISYNPSYLIIMIICISKIIILSINLVCNYDYVGIIFLECLLPTNYILKLS